MPGLKQLQSFSKDIENLGNEIEIRKQRGEKPVVVPLPQGISEEDDSQDFVLGLPTEKTSDDVLDLEAAESTSPFDDLVPETADSVPVLGDEVSPESAPLGTPNFDELFTPQTDDAGELPDLSDFETDVLPPEAEKETPLEDMDLDALLGSLDSEPAPAEPAEGAAAEPEVAELAEPNVLEIEPRELSQANEPAAPATPETAAPAEMTDFTAPEAFDEALSADAAATDDALGSLDALPDDMPEIPADATELSKLAEMPNLPQFDDIQASEATAAGLDEIPDMQTVLDTIGADDEADASAVAAGDTLDDALDGLSMPSEPLAAPASDERTVASDEPDADAAFDGVDDLSALTEPFEPAASAGLESDALHAAPQPAAVGDAADLDIDNLLSSLDMPDGSAAADDLSLDALSAETPAPTESASPETAEPSLAEAPAEPATPESATREAALAEDATDTATSDALDASEAAFTEPEVAADVQDGEAASPDNFDVDGLGNLDATMFSDNVELPSVDALMQGLEQEHSAPNDVAQNDVAPNDAADEAPIAPPSADKIPPSDDIETFDTSAIDGLDFSKESSSGSDSNGSGDIFANIAKDFPVTGSGDDFELATDFEIPGFSDTDVAQLTPKKVDSPDFSKADQAKPRNSLTEEEFAQFKKNLERYPLNLRIIVEDFIAKDEFTEDAVFEVIEKVLKKTPARSLAGHLEKLLDITINIPRDFERRSVAEYEAYKQSFQYQLKNRILPGAIACVLLMFVCYGLFRAGHQFIYKPAKAASLYKQGYTLLSNNEYAQSELKFNEAVSYRSVKKWFFTYARGYREHKQYERAAAMYNRTLKSFKHDKYAGLEYAEMELYDRANYPRAEEIVRREVLDYHVNDADGILLLGDIFLEWADSDSEKYEAARTQYATLIQLYGGTDLYLSRMMRYFIRTDRLRNVLELKNLFYASKNKSALGADDWTELSGYLLDKLYGPLSKSDEYLRSSIEDVLDMLQTAVRLAPENAVAHYNLARYYVENSNFTVAQRQLELSLDLFDKAPVRTRRTVYKEIDAARQLGELYVNDHEYLKAQTAYTRGITVFKDEHKRAGLAGNESTGKLFADMGDIDYFISGDMDSALYNYQQAITYKNDTPSLIYRVGAIQYAQKDYDTALSSFISASERLPSDPNLLLALANTLSINGDNFAAQGYYTDLISRLDIERARRERLLPQLDADDTKLVDLYVKACNNLGVTLFRLARQTGNSNLNAQATVRLSDSMRAWDALTRNPKTMLRLPGSNLAAQNSKYMMHPLPDFEPAIYTDIARVLYNDQELK